MILVGKGAPQILKQLRELKVSQGDIQAIQADFDALQHLEVRNIVSKAKVEIGRGRVIRNLSGMLGIRCALRHMK